MKRWIEWLLMVVAPPLMFVVMGIKLTTESYLFLGSMVILAGVILAGVFGRFHRIGGLHNYVKSHVRQKIVLFSALALTMGLLAAVPTLLRLFGGEDTLESYFLDLSIGGRIAVIAGHILALLLLILLENSRTKRRDAKGLRTKDVERQNEAK